MSLEHLLANEGSLLKGDCPTYNMYHSNIGTQGTLMQNTHHVYSPLLLTFPLHGYVSLTGDYIYAV